MHRLRVLQRISNCQIVQHMSSNSSIPKPGRLNVHPNPSLVDDPVHIRGSGLPPTSPVTLTLELKDETQNLHFRSESVFLTTFEGTMSTEDKAYPGGCYEGKINLIFLKIEKGYYV